MTTAQVFKIEAVVGGQVIEVVSDGSMEGTVWKGDPELIALAKLRLQMGGAVQVAGTPYVMEADYSPFGLMAALSWHHAGELFFTKIPKSVQEYLDARIPEHLREKPPLHYRMKQSLNRLTATLRPGQR